MMFRHREQTSQIPDQVGCSEMSVKFGYEFLPNPPMSIKMSKYWAGLLNPAQKLEVVALWRCSKVS